MNKNTIIETDRLIMRKLVQTDFNNLRKILQDEEVTYAYEGVFDDAETQEWLDRQIHPPSIMGMYFVGVSGGNPWCKTNPMHKYQQNDSVGNAGRHSVVQS